MLSLVTSKDYVTEAFTVDWKTPSPPPMGPVGAVKSLFWTLAQLLSRRAQLDAGLMDSFPDGRRLLAFLRMGDGRIVSFLGQFGLTWISTHEVIKVPLSLLKSSDFFSLRRKYGNNEGKYSIFHADSSPSVSELAKAIEPAGSGEPYFEIRILAPFKVSVRTSLSEGRPLPPSLKPRMKKSILHVHGGGFIATTSMIHQTYTRPLSKGLDTILFCVDYPLSPEAKFPEAPDCVFTASIFVRKLIESLGEFKPGEAEILCLGDSAGGNLVAGLTARLALENQSLPKALFLAYPAMSLDIKRFTPSAVFSFSHALLSFPMRAKDKSLIMLF